MQEQDAISLLREAIYQKESEFASQGILLKERFKIILQSLKPINLIKEAFSSQELKSSLTSSLIGMTAGFVAKKAVMFSSGNPLLKIAGTILQVLVTSVVTKNSGLIQSAGGALLKKLFGNAENNTEKAA